MKYFIILFVVFYVHTHVEEETQTFVGVSDSSRATSFSRADTNQITWYLKKGYEYKKFQSKKALRYFDRAHQLSKKLKWPIGSIHYYIYRMEKSFYSDHADSALFYSFKILNLIETLPPSLYSIKAYAQMGSVYLQKGWYRMAEKYYKQANQKGRALQLPLYEQAQITIRLIQIYIQTYDILQADQLSLSILPWARDRLLDQATRIQIYQLRAEVCLLQEKNKEAEIFCLKGYELAGDMSTSDMELMYTLAKVYLNQGRWDKLKETADVLWQHSETSPSPLTWNSRALLMLGYHSLYSNNYEKTKQIITQVLSLNRETKNHKNEKEAYILASQTALWQKNPTRFHHLRKTIDSIQHIIYQNTIKKAIDELDYEFKTNRMDEELKVQQAKLVERNLIIGLFSVIVPLCLIYIILFRQYFKKKEIIQKNHLNQLVRENKLAIMEASIQGEEQEKQRLGKDLHDSLGGMLSGVKLYLQRTPENILLLEDVKRRRQQCIALLDETLLETRIISQSLMPNNLFQFGLDTALHDEIDLYHQKNGVYIEYQSMNLENLPCSTQRQLIIYRIIQKLLSHSCVKKKDKRVCLQVFYRKNYIYVILEDDGEGINRPSLTPEEHEKITLQVDYLKGHVEIQTSSKKNNTITLSIPVQ